jgi:hypothetical protein
VGAEMEQNQKHGFQSLIQVYYLNKNTNESQWDLPTDGEIDYSKGPFQVAAVHTL